MQPNNMQFQPNMAPMQPQPAQSASQPNTLPPQNTPPVNYQTTPIPQTKKEKGHLSLLLAVIFGLATLGLVVYIVVDKVINKKPTGENETHALNAQPSTPLSQIKIPDGSPEDILKNALAGRTFAVNPSHDEFITFTTDSKYEFTYYREPNADRKKLQPSTEAGDYTVKGSTITLSNDESFQITGDYLVKSTDRVSKNKTAVYFDSLQFSKAMPNITVALSNYLNTVKKPEVPNLEKIRIDHLYCHADYSNNNMTNADSYICDTNYSLLFDEAKLATQMQAAKIANFPSYCALKNSPYNLFLLENGFCNMDNTVSSWAFVIVRTDNISYRVTGAFRTIQGSTETPQRF